MIVNDLIKKKNYDYISWRLEPPKDWIEEDILAGACKSKNGKLISIDGDSYSENEIVVRYEEWTDKDFKNGLTVVVAAEWV